MKDGDGQLKATGQRGARRIVDRVVAPYVERLDTGRRDELAALRLSGELEGLTQRILALAARVEGVVERVDLVTLRLMDGLGQLARIEDRLVSLRQHQRYDALHALADRLPDDVGLTPYEMGVFSQNGEDGVLLEVFRRIGVVHRFFVEIGAHGGEANGLLLADLLGWEGVIVEPDPAHGESLERRFAPVGAVRLVRAFATRDNIDELLASAHVPPAIDLLSIDIDGNDYWIWEALSATRPRVVVIEFNASIDADRSAVQPYSPDSQWDGTSFFGASSRALLDLGARRGYRAVHADLSGLNLVFVDESQAGDLPTITRVRRSTNYFLAGVMHPAGPSAREWTDPDAAAQPPQETPRATGSLK